MSKSDPTAIQKLDRKRQAISLLHQGVDLRTIAEDLGLGEGYVADLAREEMEYLTLQVQELQEHFVALTFARTERVMSRVMPDFDIEPPEPPDDLTNEKAVEKWRDDLRYYRRMISEGVKNFAVVARLQKDILQVQGGDKKPGNVNIEKMAVQNITLTASNDLYREALDSIHTDLHGETYPEKQMRLLEELEVIQLPDDERLNKVEKAIEKLNVGTDPAEEGRPEDG